MDKRYIFCNVETFVLNQQIQVIEEDGRIAFQYSVLISDLGTEITRLVDMEGIHHVVLTGNTVYCEEVRRHIEERNIEKYKNQLNIKVDIL